MSRPRSKAQASLRTPKARGVLECGGSTPLILAIVLLAFAAPHPALAVSFDAWISGYGLSGAAAAGDADPDNDGVENLLEYALDGFSPVIADGAENLPQMVAGTRAPGTALPLEDLTVISYDGLTPPRTGYYYLGLRYKPRAGTEGIVWLAQYAWFAANLSSWLDGTAAFLPPTAPDANGRVIRYMAGMFEAAHAAPKVFMRLRVEMP